MSLFKQPLLKQTELLSYYPEAALIIGETGNIIFANNAAKKLLQSENLEYKLITDYFAVNIETLLSCNDAKITLNITADPPINKTVQIISNVLPGSEGYIISMNDITDLNLKINDVIQEKSTFENINAFKNIFLTKLSNNLTSPLHSITGFSQAILEGLGGEVNEKQEKYLKIINKNANELLTLIEKILQLSQIEAKLFKDEYKNFDIVNMVNVLVNEFKSKTDPKKLTVKINTDNLLKKTCYSDENAVKIILTNLIENAVQSCDLGGISITLSNPEIEYLTQNYPNIPEPQDPKNYLMIQIADTGAGIPESELEDIFNPYKQIDKSAKKNLMKSLMLYVSKLFVKQLQGHISLKSELMKESVYTVILPIEKK